MIGLHDAASEGDVSEELRDPPKEMWSDPDGAPPGWTGGRCKPPESFNLVEPVPRSG